MKLLFILILTLGLFLMVQPKENFTALFTAPVLETDAIYSEMLNKTKKTDGTTNPKDVSQDIKYFNNATNIIFGLERIPLK